MGTGISIASLLGPRLWAELQQDMIDSTAPIPRRPLGRTGIELSVVGLGGIAVMGGTQAEADRVTPAPTPDKR